MTLMKTLLDQMHRYFNYEPLIFRTSLRPSISHMQSYFTSYWMVVWLYMCWLREDILQSSHLAVERWSLSTGRINSFRFQIAWVFVHKLTSSSEYVWGTWEEVFYSPVYCLVLNDNHVWWKGFHLPPSVLC